MKMTETQARLRLVGVDGTLVEPRKYAQSTLGQRSSQRTPPPDSRSIAIASDSAQERSPYAMLRRCPDEVPQRSANDTRSATVIAFQNARRELMSSGIYHHPVIAQVSPYVEFTKWCNAADNDDMNQAADIRRKNLERLIERDFDGNQTDIATMYAPENPKPNYFSDLLRPKSDKSFGEKAARKIESKVGLIQGQLDLPNSPLAYDPTHRERVRKQLLAEVNELAAIDQAKTLLAIRKLRAKLTRAM